MVKIVTAPLNINDMDDDLESNSTYIFDYNKSSLKGLDFYNYICNIGINADITSIKNTDYKIKKLLLEKYMSEKRFLHFSSFNFTILNIINLYRKNPIRYNNSIFSNNEEKLFLNEHNSLISKWKEFYDSIFYLILFLAACPNINNKKEYIKERFKGAKINNNKDLSVNMVSLLIDDDFYNYYDFGIDDSSVYYYPYYFENNLYDEKDITMFIINSNNYYYTIINKLIYDKNFRDFLESK